MHDLPPLTDSAGEGPDRAALTVCPDASGATCPRRLIVVIDTPMHLSRVNLYHALGERIGRWGRRHDDLCAFIDLSNHPLLPAQTIVGSAVQSWDDLADGVPEALASSNLLLVIGLERMLLDSPARLAAFLRARARCQTVVVLTALVARMRELYLFGDTELQIVDSIAGESDAEAATAAITRAAAAAARKANPRAQLHARFNAGAA